MQCVGSQVVACMQVPASTAVDPSAADTIASDFAAYLGTTSPWITVSPSTTGPTLALSFSALFPANAPSGASADASSLEVSAAADPAPLRLACAYACLQHYGTAVKAHRLRSVMS